MPGELILRFLLGGLIVAAFAVLGDMLRPKSFAGLLGAAPSVALATLALTFISKPASYVASEGRSMLAGAVAFCGYTILVVALLATRRLPAWLAASLAWSLWLAIAFGLWRVLLQ